MNPASLIACKDLCPDGDDLHIHGELLMPWHVCSPSIPRPPAIFDVVLEDDGQGNGVSPSPNHSVVRSCRKKRVERNNQRVKLSTKLKACDHFVSRLNCPGCNHCLFKLKLKMGFVVSKKSLLKIMISPVTKAPCSNVESDAPRFVFKHFQLLQGFTHCSLLN